MVTAVTMGMMLAMEPAERDIMERPPRKVWHDQFLCLLFFDCSVSFARQSLLRLARLTTVRCICIAQKSAFLSVAGQKAALSLAGLHFALAYSLTWSD